ncbi:MAG TPA: thioesterase family protein [Burkholderiales bacterium]|nr:thioesterase family protein [Burkholderiales bacterium]
MARSQFRFAHRLRVRWAEVDRQGIVFNGHYLTYFDVGVTEYYRALGHPYPMEDLLAAGLDLYARTAQIEFHSPAQYDDELDVCVRVPRIGHTSLEFALEIYRGDLLLVSGGLVYVSADPSARRARPVPDFLKAAIRRYEQTPPLETGGGVMGASR